jgi:hypothetical protein
MKQKPLSPAPFFSRLHILAQNRVDHSLITPPVLAEKSENIGIDAQSNLFFGPSQRIAFAKKSGPSSDESEKSISSSHAEIHLSGE